VYKRRLLLLQHGTELHMGILIQSGDGTAVVDRVTISIDRVMMKY
jgi:hypothetical protein